jgi:predicted DNA-binding protein
MNETIREKVRAMSTELEALLREDVDEEQHPCTRISEKDKMSVGMRLPESLISKLKGTCKALTMPITHLVYDAVLAHIENLEKIHETIFPEVDPRGKVRGGRSRLTSTQTIRRALIAFDKALDIHRSDKQDDLERIDG